jgi:ABC-2 type transport system ATP-binding protein
LGNAAVQTSGLRMVYDPGLFKHRVMALEGLDLEVPRGSIYGFLGQNGAGKTTTIRILVGLLHATAGRGWVLGTDIRECAARRPIGFMPENPYFYEYLSAAETLEFYGKLSGMARGDRRRRTDELLETFGLAHARHMPLRAFSKGMRQRLGLAQAIIHEPPVLILDEPMSGLDPLGRHDIRGVILSLRDRGCTVFFSSHILGDVEDVCDRVCVIHMGRKMTEGPLHALLSARVVEVELAASGSPPAGHPEAAALARRAWHDGALYHLLLDSEESAQRAKAILERDGATVRLLVPHRESLEDYFVRITREGEMAAILDAAALAQPRASAAPGGGGLSA